MTHDECLELVERVLGDRLRAIFDTRTVGCDASLAAVIASALAVDLRLVAPEYDPAKKLAGLTDGEISDLGCHLAATLDGLVVNPHHLPELEFELPFGTVAQVYLDDLSIGKESWITEHGRPGLVPYASVGSEISGPNLKMLQSRIRKLVSKHPCKAIGLPSEFRRTGLYEDRGCLRFPSFAGGRWSRAALPAPMGPSSLQIGAAGGCRCVGENTRVHDAEIVGVSRLVRRDCGRGPRDRGPDRC